MRNSKRIRDSAALRQNRRYCTGLGGGGWAWRRKGLKEISRSYRFFLCEIPQGEETNVRPGDSATFRNKEILVGNSLNIQEGSYKR